MPKPPYMTDAQYQANYNSLLAASKGYNPASDPANFGKTAAQIDAMRAKFVDAIQPSKPAQRPAYQSGQDLYNEWRNQNRPLSERYGKDYEQARYAEDQANLKSGRSTVPAHILSSQRQYIPQLEAQLKGVPPGSPAAKTLMNALANAYETVNQQGPTTDNASAAAWRKQYDAFQNRKATYDSQYNAPQAPPPPQNTIQPFPADPLEAMFRQATSGYWQPPRGGDINTAPGFPDPYGTGQPGGSQEYNPWRNAFAGDAIPYRPGGTKNYSRPGQANPMQDQPQGTPYGGGQSPSSAGAGGQLFDRTYGYGDQWAAHGSPKSMPRPRQGAQQYGGQDLSQSLGQYAPPSMYGGNQGFGQQPYGGQFGNPNFNPFAQTFGANSPFAQFGGSYTTNPYTFGSYGGQSPNGGMQSAYQQSMNAWQMPKQQLMQWGQQQQGQNWAPNYGNTMNRPDPYSLNVSGQFGNNLTDMWNNIGGFVQGVNSQASQQPVGTYLGQGNPGANYAKVNYGIQPTSTQSGQYTQADLNNINQQRQSQWQADWSAKNPGQRPPADAGPKILSFGPDGQVYDKSPMMSYDSRYLYKPQANGSYNPYAGLAYG